MGILNKENKENKEESKSEETKADAQEQLESNKDQSETPKHDPKFAFVMRALGSYSGSITQEFGYPIHTKLSSELISHLTNYMESGSIE